MKRRKALKAVPESEWIDSRTQDVIELCCLIAKDKGLSAAVRNSLKGGVMAGTGAALGGIMGGPVGIAIGGAMGGVVGWLTSRRKFKPLHTILEEMSPRKKKKLYQAVMKVLGDLKWDGLDHLLILVGAKETEIMKVISSFAKNKLHAKVKSKN